MVGFDTSPVKGESNLIANFKRGLRQQERIRATYRLSRALLASDDRAVFVADMATSQRAAVWAVLMPTEAVSVLRDLDSDAVHEAVAMIRAHSAGTAQAVLMALATPPVFVALRLKAPDGLMAASYRTGGLRDATTRDGVPTRVGATVTPAQAQALDLGGVRGRVRHSDYLGVMLEGAPATSTAIGADHADAAITALSSQMDLVDPEGADRRRDARDARTAARRADAAKQVATRQLGAPMYVTPDALAVLREIDSELNGMIDRGAVVIEAVPDDVAWALWLPRARANGGKLELPPRKAPTAAKPKAR